VINHSAGIGTTDSSHLLLCRSFCCMSARSSYHSVLPLQLSSQPSSLVASLLHPCNISTLHSARPSFFPSFLPSPPFQKFVVPPNLHRVNSANSATRHLLEEGTNITDCNADSMACGLKYLVEIMVISGVVLLMRESVKFIGNAVIRKLFVNISERLHRE
jgi:hypothetical protein